MSDRDFEDIEEPHVDAAEQQLDAIPEPDEDDEPLGEPGTPLEADPADTADQEQEVTPDDEEYR